VFKGIATAQQLLKDIQDIQGPEVKEQDVWKHPDVLRMLNRIAAVAERNPSVRDELEAAMVLETHALPPAHGGDSGHGGAG